RGRPLDRPAVGQPVGLAGNVVADVLEAQRGEPARGPWAQVSEVVVAVDHNRTETIQYRGGGGVERLERDADPAGKVRLGELGLGQDVDDLRARLDQAVEPGQLYAAGHGGSIMSVAGGTIRRRTACPTSSSPTSTSLASTRASTAAGRASAARRAPSGWERACGRSRRARPPTPTTSTTPRRSCCSCSPAG